jgi:ankyrin repeat protein
VTGISELMHAQYRGDEATVARLLGQGHEPNIWEAAAVGNAARVAALLDTEPQLVNSWSVDGGQPLHFASYFGRLDAMQLLLERGASVNEHAPGFNDVAPINSAAANDHKPNDVCTQCVILLLEHGADPHAAQRNGSTALDTARFTGNDALIELLEKLP